MKVRELIADLGKYDPEMEVAVPVRAVDEYTEAVITGTTVQMGDSPSTTTVWLYFYDYRDGGWLDS